jgi:hypothetical protein
MYSTLSHIYVFLTCLLRFWGSSFYLTVCLSRTCIAERSPGDLLWCCMFYFGCVCESAVCRSQWIGLFFLVLAVKSGMVIDSIR